MYIVYVFSSLVRFDGKYKFDCSTKLFEWVPKYDHQGYAGRNDVSTTKAIDICSASTTHNPNKIKSDKKEYWKS